MPSLHLDILTSVKVLATTKQFLRSKTNYHLYESLLMTTEKQEIYTMNTSPSRGGSLFFHKLPNLCKPLQPVYRKFACAMRKKKQFLINCSLGLSRMKAMQGNAKTISTFTADKLRSCYGKSATHFMRSFLDLKEWKSKKALITF